MKKRASSRSTILAEKISDARKFVQILLVVLRFSCVLLLTIRGRERVINRDHQRVTLIDSLTVTKIG